MPRKLGRRTPTDWEHVARYPLSALIEIPKVPVVLGINWYSNFDYPVTSSGERWLPGASTRKTWWIGRGGLGTVRGGHAICAKPYRVSEPSTWQDFYDQGNEGACVGFACSRMMSLLNRERYWASWLYAEAQKIDEWPTTPPQEGTSVRAGCDILRDRGHCSFYRSIIGPPDPADGIAANRWATTWQEVRDTLGLPDSYDGVPLMNSWGHDYPHIVRITDEAGERVLREDGEACLVTDR